MVVCEVCVDSVESAVNAQQGGAARVELCADLMEGGITPSYGMILQVRKKITIGLHVLIRPRGGDFLFTDDEFEVMKHDIETCKQLKVDGVVIGILQADGSIDVARTKQLIDLARPMSVTFHRAFDMAKDPFASLEAIINLGVDRLLTSGQESSCLEGLDVLTELVQRAGNRIIIMPGGGITERNVNRIMKGCEAKEFHISGRSTKDSAMQYRNTKCFMGGVLRPPEFSISVADSSKIQTFLNNASV